MQHDSKLTIDGHPLTPEQAAIVQAARDSSVRVQALAGTGKTSTLRAIVADTPAHVRTTYLVFNRKMREAAERTFDARRVNVKTFHGLAKAGTARRFRGRTPDAVRTRDLRTILGSVSAAGKPLSRGETLTAIADTLRKFLQSDAPDVHRDHVPYRVRRKLHDEAVSTVLKEAVFVDGAGNVSARGQAEINNNVGSALRYIVERARTAYQTYADPSAGRALAIPHDVYLKAWQLSGADIDCDLLLVDEAQDLNPVMVDIVAQQRRARVIAVGDSRQQIYTFRGSVDALERLAGTELPLTTSFRFGPDIADRANDLLHILGSPYLLTGRGPRSRAFDANAPYCELFRTNAALLETLVEAVQAGRKVHCTRAIGPLVRLLRDLLAFDAGNADEAHDPRVRYASDWDGLRDDLADDTDAAPLVAMVEKSPHRAEGVADALEGFRSTPIARADVAMTTAHQSKGLEFDQVALSRDFGGRLSQGDEEKRLLYVAMTRGKRAMDVPGVVSGDIRKAMTEAA